MLPKASIYDPELTVGLPTGVTGPSAFNALAHCVEALWAPGANPITSALALEGVRAIAALAAARDGRPDDVDARGELLYGAYLSGMALGATAAGLHHKLCHVLGGTFGLVHADAHSVILPHVVAFNAPALPDEMARLAEALGRARTATPAGALWDLAVASGVPTSLAELGLPARRPCRGGRAGGGRDRRRTRGPSTEPDVLALLERPTTATRPAADADTDERSTTSKGKTP